MTHLSTEGSPVDKRDFHSEGLVFMKDGAIDTADFGCTKVQTGSIFSVRLTSFPPRAFLSIKKNL